MANYEVAYPIYSLLLVISSSGLPTAISKLVAEHMATGRPGAALYVFKSSRRLLLLIGTVCSAALLAAAGVYAAAVGMPDSKYAIMGIAPALLAVAVMCAYRGYFQGMQNMGATAVSQLIEQIGKLLLGLTLAKKFMALGAGYAALGATIGIAVSEFAALAVIMLMYAFRRKSPIKPLIHQTENFSQLSKKLLAIAVPITIGAAIMPLTGVMDSLTIVNELKALGFAQEAAQSAYAMLRSVVTPIINLPAVLR
jgi:stage V sporulation protein B